MTVPWKNFFLSPFGWKRKEQSGLWFASHAVGVHGYKTPWLNHYHPNRTNTIKPTGKPRVGVPWRSFPPLGWGGEDSPFLQPPFWLSVLSASPTAPGSPAPPNPRSYKTSSQKTSLTFMLCNQPVSVRRHQACVPSQWGGWGFHGPCLPEIFLRKACCTCLIASLTTSLWKCKSLGNEPKS